MASTINDEHPELDLYNHPLMHALQSISQPITFPQTLFNPPLPTTHTPTSTRSHLKHNRITQLPDGLFRGQRRLRKLFLDDNRIAAIPAGLFAQLGALEWLMLGDNRLRRLPLWELHPLKRLRTLNVSSNRLQLDGDDEEMFPVLPLIMEM